jgi:hypothetical protein
MIAWPAASLLLGVVLGAGSPHSPPTTQPTAEVMVRDAGNPGRMMGAWHRPVLVSHAAPGALRAILFIEADAAPP